MIKSTPLDPFPSESNVAEQIYIINADPRRLPVGSLAVRWSGSYRNGLTVRSLTAIYAHGLIYS